MPTADSANWQLWSSVKYMKWTTRHQLCIVQSAFTCEKHQIPSQTLLVNTLWSVNMFSMCMCEKVLVHRLHFYMQPGLIRKYGKCLRTVKTTLSTFSSLYNGERWNVRWFGYGDGQLWQGKEEHLEQEQSDGKILPIIGSIKALLKCNSLI